jgi:hypothetical protein
MRNCRSPARAIGETWVALAVTGVGIVFER